MNGQWFMVNVKWEINLSFTIDHIPSTMYHFFWGPTVSGAIIQEEGPATETGRVRIATITVPQAQTPNPAKSQRPKS